MAMIITIFNSFENEILFIRAGKIFAVCFEISKRFNLSNRPF